MSWVNTALIPDMDMDRQAITMFNETQPPGASRIPQYPCHVHGMLWPEKATKDKLIYRFVVRHFDPKQCILGSQARLLFIRVHVVGQFQAEGTRVPASWHHNQVFHLDQDPAEPEQPAQQEMVYWDSDPQQVLQARALTKACTQLQRDVGVEYKGSRAKQSRNEATANGQILGWTDQQTCAQLHWAMALKEKVYSNLSHVPMITSQGHLGQGGCFFILGRGQHPTWDYPLLVQHFFPASMFSSDPTISWDDLIERMQRQNAANPACSLEGRVEFAKRIHHPGGLRDCLLQDFALEGGMLGMTYASAWFQQQMQKLLADPEGRDQWQRFQAEVRASHAFGLHVMAFCGKYQGNILVGRMMEELMTKVTVSSQQQATCIQLQQQMLQQMQGMAHAAAVRDRQAAGQAARQAVQNQAVLELGQEVVELLSPQKQRASEVGRIAPPSPGTQMVTAARPVAAPAPAAAPPAPVTAPLQRVPFQVDPADPLPLAARDPRPDYFSLAGVPQDLLYVPACSEIKSVAQIMELWEEGPDPAMSALVKGVARIPFSQLHDMPQGRWRGREREMKRVKWEINPGECRIISASQHHSGPSTCSPDRTLQIPETDCP